MAQQPRSVTQLFDEHQQLRELLRTVQEAVAARRSDVAVENLIGELAGQVAEHFRHEEAGGYFVEVIQVAPRLAHRAETLQQQHARLSEQLGGLRRLAKEAEQKGQWEELTTAMEQFCTTFQMHELAENQLLQQAYTDDIGVDD